MSWNPFLIAPFSSQRHSSATLQNAAMDDHSFGHCFDRLPRHLKHSTSSNLDFSCSMIDLLIQWSKTSLKTKFSKINVEQFSKILYFSFIVHIRSCKLFLFCPIHRVSLSFSQFFCEHTNVR